jgi:ubiquitin-protein ligase
MISVFVERAVIERKKGTPRDSSTYRAARRNAKRSIWVGRVFKTILTPRQPWPGIQPTARLYHPPVRPNRSKKWKDIWIDVLSSGWLPLHRLPLYRPGSR